MHQVQLTQKCRSKHELRLVILNSELCSKVSIGIFGLLREKDVINDDDDADDWESCSHSKTLSPCSIKSRKVTADNALRVVCRP